MTRLLRMSIKEAGYGSFVDVIECILESTIGGLETVHVMHECSLTQNQLQAYLDLLLQRGLVKIVEPSLKIQTTEKGLAFISDYNQLNADWLVEEEANHDNKRRT